MGESGRRPCVGGASPRADAAPKALGSCHNGCVPMRQDCKNFQSRTYRGGETVRKCNLDLAPDAPWRCPDMCPAYERRFADVNWAHGSLVTPPTPPEPLGLGDDDGRVAAVLDAAEEIVNAAGPSVVADVDLTPPEERGFWKKFFGKR